MKRWISNHRVLLTACVAVLLGAAILAGALYLFGAGRMRRTSALDRPEPAVSDGNAVVSGGNAAAAEPTPEDTLNNIAAWRAHRLTDVVPMFGGYGDSGRGVWQKREDVDAALAEQAIAAFVGCVSGPNSVFNGAWKAGELGAVFYADGTGFRDDIWRIQSRENDIVGVLRAEDLSPLILDRAVVPSYELHESIQAAKVENRPEGASDGGEIITSNYDVQPLAKRIAGALGTEVQSVELSGLEHRTFQPDGVTTKLDILIVLADGRQALALMYGDRNETLEAVAVYPDQACMMEHVYWRVDLSMPGEGNVVLVSPRDFVKGEPGGDDLPEQDAIDFYYRFLKAANSPEALNGIGDGDVTEPNLTFYVDRSGTRENYWHVEGREAIFNLTSRSGFVMDLICSEDRVGHGLGLMEIPYERMGGPEYEAATKALLEGMFGPGSVKEVLLNAVYDGHYCTVAGVMEAGPLYECMYKDGLLQQIWYFYSLEGWSGMSGWEADTVYVNLETGETFHME